MLTVKDIKRKAKPTKPKAPKPEPVRRTITQTSISAYLSWAMDNPKGE